MLRRLFRIGLTLGLLGGVVFALTKVRDARRPAVPEPGPAWEPLAAPVQTVAALVEDVPVVRAPAPAAAWVEPTGDVCPTSHPVKAKLSSKIFHVPGMLNYGRTKPDRCYRDPESAEGDGLRPAKR